MKQPSPSTAMALKSGLSTCVKHVVLGAIALYAALLGLFGWFSGGALPDTPTYIAALSSENVWGATRHPLYGWFLSAVGLPETGYPTVAVLHFMLHALSVIVLERALRGWVSAKSAAAVALSVLIAQSVLLNGRYAIPEAPAISFLVLGFATLLLGVQNRLAWIPTLLLTTLFVGLAYTLRPTMLPAIVILPLFGLGLTLSKPRALLLALLLSVPFLAQSAWRYHKVADFNIVSYGGFQTAAMAGFMLTPEVIARLPASVQETAREALFAREKGEAEGVVLKTPLNSKGDPSFHSAAVGYFDLYARTHDEYLLKYLIWTRHADETWVQFNARLQRMALATFWHAPDRWLAWVIGGSARMAGRMIVTNTAFVMGVFLCLLALVWRKWEGISSHPRSDLIRTAWLAAAWFCSTAPLTLLITFPATRYIDTASVFLPSVLFVVARRYMYR
jgi:hypothetical protein